MNLQAVYPNEDDINEEMSFEELRAKSRGWLARDWAAESKQGIGKQLRTEAIQNQDTDEAVQPPEDSQSTQDSHSGPDLRNSPNTTLDYTNTIDLPREGKSGRARKTRIREVKGETQTSMLLKYRRWTSN